MKAILLIRRRVVVAADAYVDIVVWRTPASVPPSEHAFKHRLAYVVNNECVLRYDNERGEGDYRHVGIEESALRRQSCCGKSLRFGAGNCSKLCVALAH